MFYLVLNQEHSFNSVYPVGACNWLFLIDKDLKHEHEERILL